MLVAAIYGTMPALSHLFNGAAGKTHVRFGALRPGFILIHQEVPLTGFLPHLRKVHIFSF